MNMTYESTNFGDVLRDQIRNQRSRGHIAKAIETSLYLCRRSELPEDFIQLARLYTQIGDLTSAYAWVVLSIEKWPNYAHNHIAEAYCFLLMKKFVAAYHSLDKAMGLDYSQEQEAAIHRVRGQIYSGVGMSNKAIECFLDSLQIDDNDIDTHLMLAYEYTIAGFLELSHKSLNTLMTTKDLGHRLPEVWSQYCLNLIRDGRLEEARFSGAELVKKFPNSNYSMIPAIVLSESTGLLEEAFSLCNLYIDRFPRDPAIEQIRERLEIRLIPIRQAKALGDLL
jgi:tetratricopeptide (TPR) repeat protein